jgi:hypothetical protein
MLRNGHVFANLIRNNNIRCTSVTTFVNGSNFISNCKGVSDLDRLDKADSIITKGNGKTTWACIAELGNQRA